jgi:hypothetical protein
MELGLEGPVKGDKTMTTTRNKRALLFLGLLAVALLSTSLVVLAEAPTEAPKAAPTLNPVDEGDTGPEPTEESTCSQAPWGKRTPEDLLCLEEPELVPSAW